MMTFFMKFYLKPMTSYFNNNLLLILMSIWILLLMLTNYQNKIMVFFIGLILFLFLLTDNLWEFYILYEFSIIPMIMLIITFGKNPYRFPASLFMLLYTLFFSLPCLMIMLINWKWLNSLSLSMSCNYLNLVFSWWLLLMFFVKAPIFFLHYWLPKAHVEASTVGSIILASGLLKMGSLGSFMIFKWLNFKVNNFSLLIMGVLFANLMCILQTDFKKMIAFMSISHMTLSILSLMIFKTFSLISFMLMNITHSLTSALLFYFSGVMYKISNNRLIYYFPLMINSSLFILMSTSIFANLGIPPFSSFISELMMFSAILNYNYYFCLILIMIIILATIYSMMLISHSMNKNNKIFTLSISSYLFSFYLFLVLISVTFLVYKF